MINNGIDIIKVNRIESIKYLDKLFTLNELEYFKEHKSLETKAGIYAAKEALLKSVGVSLNVYSFLDIEVLHIGYKPYFVFHNKLEEYIKKESLNFSLSISHDGEYAIASVICYKKV